MGASFTYQPDYADYERGDRCSRRPMALTVVRARRVRGLAAGCWSIGGSKACFQGAQSSLHSRLKGVVVMRDTHSYSHTHTLAHIRTHTRAHTHKELTWVSLSTSRATDPSATACSRKWGVYTEGMAPPRGCAAACLCRSNSCLHAIMATSSTR